MLAVSIGLGALIFLRSFIFGAQNQMVGNVINTLTGDIQILPTGQENIYNTNGAIENPETIRQLLKNDPRVLHFAEEVGASGIAASATASLPTFASGYNPNDEASTEFRIPIIQGRRLTTADDYGIVIGEKMRKILEIEIGDKVVVTFQDYHGGLAGEAFKLTGTFETGNDQIDNGNVLLLRPTLQRLLGFEHRISKFILKIDPHYQPDELAKDFRKKIQEMEADASPYQGTSLSVMTWEEILPLIAQMIRFQNGMILVIVFIVLTVVTTGILNTLMMSITERTREFGLMAALGTSPSAVMMVVTLESFFLTTAGALAGILFGIGFTFYFGHVGIDLSRFLSTVSNLLIGSHVYPRLDISSLLLFLGIVTGGNLVVSLQPAWRASRLQPVEAMRV